MSSISNQSLTKPFDNVAGGFVIQAIWVLTFSSLTALGAQIEIPHSPVPYTMQTLFVLLSGALLGWRNGALSQVAYLAAGALGAPVFASAGFGLTRLLGPTGGYLFAFPIAAAVVGLLVQRRRSLPWSFVSMAAGLVVIFTCGTLQLQATMIHDWPTAFSSGFLIFSWWDVLKLCAAAMTYHEIAKRWPRIPRQ